MVVREQLFAMDPQSAKMRGRQPVGVWKQRWRGRARNVAGDDWSLVECFERALAARATLLADPHTNAFRVFNGAADGIDGLVIEKLGDVLIAQLHEGRLRLGEAEVRDLCAQAQRRLGARAVYRKSFARDRPSSQPGIRKLHWDPTPWLGQPVDAELPVLENSVSFLVHPYDGYSVGLFLEHRENRQRVRVLAAGRTVLNAFAYTCAFSVAAALGDAATTISVDLSKKHLEWGKRNFTANKLDLSLHRFICSDIFDYYRRAKRQRRRFDLIILDPPTFARSKRVRQIFVLAKDLERLVLEAMELLSPEGYLLLATNHRRTSRRRLEQAVAVAAGARRFQIIARPRLPLDFVGDPGYAKSIVAWLA
jgi:23S rRNA (cytosine1962-C5)-methyltransferase